jgi:hypothetical protein
MRKLRTLASSRERTFTPTIRATAVARARSDPERRHGVGMLKRRAGRVDANLTGRWIDLLTPLLVTSASGANGNGYGALLAFDHDGEPLGPFSDDDGIVDSRGLALEPEPGLLFLNSVDRVLALDQAGKVVRDTGVIAGLNPGGGTFGPDGRYYVGLRDARTVLALPPDLKSSGEHVLPPGIVPFPRGFGFNADGKLFLSSGTGPDGVSIRRGPQCHLSAERSGIGPTRGGGYRRIRAFRSL